MSDAEELAQLRAERAAIIEGWPFHGDLEGKTLKEAIAAEMSDYEMIIDHCTQIYGAASGYRISKPNTLPSNVIAIMEDIAQKDIDEAVREAVHDIIEDLDAAFDAVLTVGGVDCDACGRHQEAARQGRERLNEWANEFAPDVEAPS